MQIRWLDDALADLTRIYRYISAHDPNAAARVVPRVQAAVRLLEVTPYRGRPGRWPGTGELVVPGTRYLVPYRVAGDLIEILRVFHSARRWPDRAPD
jgi:toxin ParE1/3/4